MDWKRRYPDAKILIDFKEMEEDDSLSIYGNESLIKTVFVNLIDNAVKFSSNKTAQLNISFKDQNISIEFIDKGIGINLEDMEHIYEPFYRANNAQDIKGHGIGLSLCKKIVELHKGSINVSSVINKGTHVLVQLPYKLI